MLNRSSGNKFEKLFKELCLMVKAAFFGVKILKIDTVYGNGHKNQIGQIVNLYPEIVSSDNFDFHPKN